jgi:hypothetical protein
MSIETVTHIIGRAAQDPEFRADLFAHPAALLAGLDLTAAETAQLSALTPESFDTLAGELDARASFSVIWGTEAGPRPKLPGMPEDPHGFAIGG